MGLSMRVQTERGEPKESGVYLPDDAIPFDAEKYPLLSSITPYEDTVFSSTQCALVVAEWDCAASEPRWKKETQEWMTIRMTAARCASEHLYLKFIGD